MISGGAKAVGRRERSRATLLEKMLPSIEELLAAGANYTDLSVEDIIDRAGVPRSTFYYHFRDKGELLVAVSANATGEIVDVSRGLYQEGLHRSRDGFTAAVRATASAWLAHVPLMNALAELAAYNPAVREQFLAGWGVAQQHVAEHIREGQAHGFVRGDLHPEHTAGWLTWMAERGMAQLVGPAPFAEYTEIVDALAAIVSHTLYLDDPTSNGDQP